MPREPLHPDDRKPVAAVDSVQVTDRDGRQRFLVTASKPPSIINGKEYPRSGPDGTHVVFNDGNGSEMGGITATSNGAMLGLDWANRDAIHLETEYEGKAGRASLLMTHMPDPDLPPDEARTPLGVSLHCSTEYGTGLQLCDSQGRPRIVLQVDTQDVPSIRILDEHGNIVTQYPDAT